MANLFRNKLFKLYTIWTGISLLLVVLPPFLDLYYPGGAQVGMTTLSKTLDIAIWGYILLSGFFLLNFRSQHPGSIIFNGLVFSSLLYFRLSLVYEQYEAVYTISATRHVGSDVIKSERDYREFNGHLKAIRHWRNYEKDSVWVDYNFFGHPSYTRY